MGLYSVLHRIFLRRVAQAGGASKEIQAGIMGGSESNTALGVSKVKEAEIGGVNKAHKKLNLSLAA